MYIIILSIFFYNTMDKIKDRQYNGQKKGQIMIYKTLHRKLKIEQQKPRGELGCSGNGNHVLFHWWFLLCFVFC